MPSDHNKDDKDSNLPPNHSPNLVDCYPLNLQKHFQVQNITTLKPDTDNQGSQLPPTHAPATENC